MKRALLLLAVAAPALAERPLPLEWPAFPFIQHRMAYVGASLVAPVASDHVTTQREMLARPPFLDRGLAVDLDALPPAAAAAFHQAAAGGVLSAADFQLHGARAYFDARPFPPHLGTLLAEQSTTATRWDTVEVDSLITRSRRRIRFPLDEVLAATLEKREIAPGTVFFAEELDASGRVRETHVTRMRIDHRTDFALYDAAGRRQMQSADSPQKFQAPLSCFTCHAKTSQRPSPFWEFPDPAPANAGFQPAIHETLTAREGRLIQRMSRPKRDSDVFGDYAGLAAVRLQRRAAAGPVEPWVSALLARVQALYPQG